MAVVIPLLLAVLLDVDNLHTTAAVSSVVAVIVCVVAVRTGRADRSPGWTVLAALGACAATTVFVAEQVDYGWPVAMSWSLVVLAGACAAQSRTRRDLLLTGLVALAAVVSPWSAEPASATNPDNGNRILYVLVMFIVTVTSVGIGLLARSHRLRLRETRQTALAAERRDMARELHDVIAHEVTGIVVLSEAAAAVTDDPVARQALERIQASSLRALDEIRAMVSTLRADLDEDGPPLAPQIAGAAGLRSLVDEFARSAQPTAVIARIEEIDLPVPVAMAAHRILGEAFTNVRRHASDARTVEVVVTADDSAVTIRVSDDGSGLAGIGGGSGYGLLGVGERAAALGGSAHAGRDEDGRWTVTATLPRTLG